MRLTPHDWVALPTIGTRVRVLPDANKGWTSPQRAIVTGVKLIPTGCEVTVSFEDRNDVDETLNLAQIEPINSVPRTITLPELYSFGDALLKLDAGECVGIQPYKEGTTQVGYVIRFQPKWMNPEGDGRILCWADRSRSPSIDIDGDIRVDQLLGKWKLVVLDCSKFHH